MEGEGEKEKKTAYVVLGTKYESKRGGQKLKRGKESHILALH